MRLRLIQICLLCGDIAGQRLSLHLYRGLKLPVLRIGAGDDGRVAVLLLRELIAVEQCNDVAFVYGVTLGEAAVHEAARCLERHVHLGQLELPGLQRADVGVAEEAVHVAAQVAQPHTRGGKRRRQQQRNDGDGRDDDK